VERLGAFPALANLELHRLTFVELAGVGVIDVGEMDEDVAAAVRVIDEAERG
jgi:hypothetical protein